MPTRRIIFLYGQAVGECRHNIDKVFDGYYVLQYMNGGGVDLSVGEQHYRLEGRWFWSSYPGPRISFHPARGYSSWSHRYLAFRGDIVLRWEREGIFPVQPQRPPKGLDYATRFDELLTLSQRGDKWGARLALNVMESVLLELAEARESPKPISPWLQRVLATLHDSATAAPPDYEQLAQSAGMSITTFRRHFRAAMGLAPHEYLLQCRINAARQLLARTNLPVKEIAQRLGYNDVFFFTRQFTKAAGVPPAQYRKSCAG